MNRKIQIGALKVDVCQGGVMVHERLAIVDPARWRMWGRARRAW